MEAAKIGSAGRHGPIPNGSVRRSVHCTPSRSMTMLNCASATHRLDTLCWPSQTDSSTPMVRRPSSECLQVPTVPTHQDPNQFHHELECAEILMPHPYYGEFRKTMQYASSSALKPSSCLTILSIWCNRRASDRLQDPPSGVGRLPCRQPRIPARIGPKASHLRCNDAEKKPEYVT